MTTARPQRVRTATRAEARARGALVVLVPAALALLAAGLPGCVPASGKTGAPGEKDVALFDAESELVFGERLTAGSRVTVYVAARRGDDEERVVEGTLRSSDEDVVRVESSFVRRVGEGDTAYRRHEALLEVTGPGEAHLLLEGADGEVIDQKLLKAAVPKAVELLDGTLLGSAVDARLPERLALVDGEPVTFAVAATDRCGGGLLDLGGVRVAALDPATVDDEEPEASPYLDVSLADTGAWVLEGALPDDDPLTPRSAVVQLQVPGVDEPIRYQLKVVPPSAVDEVDVAVAAAEPGVATLWGRAFADDQEVIGLSYEWDSNDRVTLSVGQGPLTRATISFPAEGEPLDERPALVSAEVFGTEEELDLLTLKDESELRPGRVPPVESTPPPVGPSCGGAQETCDPYAVASLFGALLLGRRLTRVRRVRRERARRS